MIDWCYLSDSQFQKILLQISDMEIPIRVKIDRTWLYGDVIHFIKQ